jgi:hypothetical protein
MSATLPADVLVLCFHGNLLVLFSLLLAAEGTLELDAPACPVLAQRLADHGAHLVERWIGDTPLFSLRGYLDAIATGLGNPRERLDQAQAKADQIDRLITGLFDYARAEIGQTPQLQTTDLADAVIDATAAFELAAEERAVKLRVNARPGTSVRIDRDGFERALANVLDNALRHTWP